MNRRSVLRWLGLAPVAAPAAMAAASAPALPPIDYSGLTESIRMRNVLLGLHADGTSRLVIDADAVYIKPSANGMAPIFTFDGERLTVPSLAVPHAAG